MYESKKKFQKKNYQEENSIKEKSFDLSRRMEQDQIESGSSSPLFTPEQSPSIGQRSLHFENLHQNDDQSVAITKAPNYVEGFYHFNEFLSSNECEKLIEEVTKCDYFDVENGRDQAMLFGMRNDNSHFGLPIWAKSLLEMIESRLRTIYSKDLNEKVLSTLFDPPNNFEFTRQFILNVYSPGQGISSHIDLPKRFLDGIMILSFGSGIAMNFSRLDDDHERDPQPPFSLYLEPGSICILTGESRWNWTHGISSRDFDLVKDQSNSTQIRKIKRNFRFSITIRWLKIQSESKEDISQSQLRA